NTKPRIRLRNIGRIGRSAAYVSRMIWIACSSSRSPLAIAMPPPSWAVGGDGHPVPTKSWRAASAAATAHGALSPTLQRHPAAGDAALHCVPAEFECGVAVAEPTQHVGTADVAELEPDEDFVTDFGHGDETVFLAEAGHDDPSPIRFEVGRQPRQGDLDPVHL